MSQAVLKFSRLTQNAFSPTKASEKAAGFDLKRYLFLITSCISYLYKLAKRGAEHILYRQLQKDRQFTCFKKLIKFLNKLLIIKCNFYYSFILCITTIVFIGVRGCGASNMQLFWTFIYTKFLYF